MEAIIDLALEWPLLTTAFLTFMGTVSFGIAVFASYVLDWKLEDE